MALGQLLYGPLADKYGRRIPLVIGIVIFIVSSLAIALAPNIQMFNGFRFIQAIGGCSGMVISRAIIQDVYDQKESAQALSLMMVIQGVGPIVAPVLGAYLLLNGSWNVIFTFWQALDYFVWLLPINTYLNHYQKNNDKRKIWRAFIRGLKRY